MLPKCCYNTDEMMTCGNKLRELKRGIFVLKRGILGAKRGIYRRKGVVLPGDLFGNTPLPTKIDLWKRRPSSRQP